MTSAKRVVLRVGLPRQGAGRTDEPGHRGDADRFPASAFRAWCSDPASWPDVLLAYEALTGERLRAPTSFDVEQHVMPLLQRALDRGEIVLAEPVAKKRSGDAGVHIQKKAPDPAPPPRPPPKLSVASPPASAGPLVPPFGVDQDAQAAALVDAAKAGIPFCEECEKARQQQAAEAQH